jgi:hypothetical protein
VFPDNLVRGFARIAVACLASLLIGGCGLGVGGFDGIGGPDTGPFAHPPGKASALAAPVPDGGGVVVRAIAGTSDGTAGALRSAMVKALADQEIPAMTSGGNRWSRFLQGIVTATPQGTATMRLQIAWALTDPAGNAAGSKTVTSDVPLRAWEQADPATIKAIAGNSAAVVAALVRGPMPVEARQVKRMPLHVRPVIGVSHIDGLALRRAMEQALRERDYNVQPQLADDALVVAGNVVLGEAKAGQQPIHISWTVMDGGGRELGRLSQDNTLAVGSGPPRLAGLASAIAEAAADGIADVLDNMPPGTLSPTDAKAGAPKAPNAPGTK